VSMHESGDDNRLGPGQNHPAASKQAG
jgi:hypothetical protein